MQQLIQPGVLYIVATPIGNLADISLRALEILKQVTLIAAEDTRHSRQLLQHYQINTPLIAYHEHNEQDKSNAIIQRLQQGQSIALISDAGTPLISDPGCVLIRMVQDLGITVCPIPGACAAITALSAAGLATDRFCFEGFLPAKPTQRDKVLQNLQQETRTIVFYEAPHRILETLQAMVTIFGAEREATLAKELTKTFETIRKGSLITLLQWLNEDPVRQKGEFVILVAGATEDRAANEIEASRVLNILLTAVPIKTAAQLAAEITGLKKNYLYQMALAQKES